MPRWVETDWYRYFFEEDHKVSRSDSNKWSDGITERNYWRVKKESLDTALNNLQEYCNDRQYEIKSIMPITRAQSYEYGQSGNGYQFRGNGGAGWGWGIGQGWGINMTDGFVALLQRIEDLTQEEFDRRVVIRNEKKILEEKKQKIRGTMHEKNSLIKELKQKQLEIKTEIDASQNVVSTEITQKKGLIGKKYMIDNHKFNDEKAALEFKAGYQVQLDGLIKKAETIDASLARESKTLDTLEAELEELD